MADTTPAVKAILGLKFRLRTTPDVERRLGRLVGMRRWAWNWGLEQCQKHYAETGKHLGLAVLDKRFTTVRAETPWLQEESKWVPRLALRDLEDAYSRFFDAVKEQKRKPDGRLQFEAPTFKKRGRSKASFRIPQSQGQLRVEGDAFNLPKVGWVRFRKSRPIRGRLLSATVSERAGKWFVSFQVEQQRLVPENDGPPIGVDLGLSRQAVLSDGTVVEAPKYLARCEARLRAAQRRLSRKVKGSANRRKAARRVARIHEKVRNQRKDFQDKLVHALCKNHAVVCIEDLDVQGMREGSRRNKSLAEARLRGLRSGLEQKAAWFGCKVVVVDRFYPSTKTCSACGNKQEVPLAMRTYSCQRCGMVADRDWNAAKNVLAAGLAASACGATVRPSLTVGLVAGKQEALEARNGV